MTAKHTVPMRTVVSRTSDTLLEILECGHEVHFTPPRKGRANKAASRRLCFKCADVSTQAEGRQP